MHYQAVLLPAFSSLNGALGRNRTHNLLIRSQALYPVELLALFLSYNAFLYYHIPLAFASRFLTFLIILR